MIRTLTLVGTRPEAIKLAPVIGALAERPAEIESRVLESGQHALMARDVLERFGISCDIAMTPAHEDLAASASSILAGVARTIGELRPDVVVVQGDTTTAMAGALAGFYARVPVAHVEAGLRTGDRRAPFPEEMHRRIIDEVSDLLFAPTETSRRRLLAERVPHSRIHVTGNTVVDALATVQSNGTLGASPVEVAPSRRLVLLTLHRRESIGEPMRRVLSAVRRIVVENEDIELACPVHPNPSVRASVESMLEGLPRTHLLPALDYWRFLALLSRAHVVLTDSGGVQEEAPSLDVPVVVLRDATERIELLDAGGALLVGTDPERIVEATTRIVRSATLRSRMARAANPFGDGKAAERIVNALVATFAAGETDRSSSHDDRRALVRRRAA